MSSEVIEAIENIPTFGRRDAAALTDRIIDVVVKELRRDPTLHRSSTEWWLAFGDLHQRLTDQFIEEMLGVVDLDCVLRTIEMAAQEPVDA